MSKPIQIAVVGAGLVGKQHIHAIRQSSTVELAAIVDPNSETDALAVAEGVSRFVSIEALFEHQPPAGVVLATPTKQHVAQGLYCVEKRCPLLVEKPISDVSVEGQSLVSAAAKASVPVLVGHHRRHNPIISAAKDMIETGDLGKVRSAQATCWFYKPDDYFETAPWRTQQGAGPISVNLVHDIDLLRHLIGDVVAVQAQACPSVRGFENEDLASALLEFENGAIATVSVSDSIVAPWSWEHTAQENPAFPVTDQHSMIIGGSDGSLTIPDLTLWTHNGVKSWVEDISSTTLDQASSSPLLNQITHFGRVIEGCETPLVSGAEGLKSLQVVEAIQQAAISKERIVF